MKNKKQSSNKQKRRKFWTALSVHYNLLYLHVRLLFIHMNTRLSITKTKIISFIKNDEHNSWDGIGLQN